VTDTPEIVARLLDVALLAWVTSFIGVLVLRRWAFGLGFVDVPNLRSSHAHPTPRAGGLPLVLTVLVGLTALSAARWVSLPSVVLAWCVGAFLVAAVSLADDRWRLPVGVRLAAQVAGTLVLVAGGGTLGSVQVSESVAWSLGWLTLPVTFLWVIGFTNAYNFMDGIDGLAAGQAMVTALTMGWLGYLLGNQLVAVFMVLLASATLGFLVLNWPPANLPGRCGQRVSGFHFRWLAVLTASSLGGGPPFLAWAAVLSPFILDTAVTLACRVARRERWYEPHRQHYYQRLVRCGWPHLVVTGLYVTVSALCGVVAILCYGYRLVSSTVVILLVCVQFGLLVLVVRC
jgi:UDP-N-acetylmuramyl pentapeptide phosphotransferase/UDP-N-acetylglucosamine-1-phosphate transferase